LATSFTRLLKNFIACCETSAQNITRTPNTQQTTHAAMLKNRWFVIEGKS
jgi:predicted nucleotide-binding protein